MTASAQKLPAVPRRDYGRILLLWSCIAVTGVIVWSLSPLALLYLLTDGVVAVLVVAAASLAGLWGVALILPRYPLPLRWKVLIGAGLGVGALCLAVLMLGLAGWLSRALWLGILGLAGLAGLVRLMMVLAGHWPRLMPEARRFDPQPQTMRSSAVVILVIGLMPFLALSLLVSTVPPGVLWAEEARGYDVLEYHLQVPKEYYLRGRIDVLPHNIYSNFPMNAEMLYLLAMVIKQEPIESAVLAKLFNAVLGVLFVVSAWLAGREYHPGAGVVSALLAGSAPWIMYLCGVAYVENGMLFFGMLSLACLCLYERGLAAGRAVWRLALAAGMFAGLACGFKYTAVAMIGAPWTVVLAVLAGRRRLSHVMAFALGGLLTLGPWLLKNSALTGNPVFPLGYRLLGAKPELWNTTLAEQWQAAHRAAPGETSMVTRLARLKDRVLLDPRLGWGPVVLALPILLSRHRTRLDVVLWLALVLQSAVWLLQTHLYARFAVVLLIPLCVLGGRSLLAAGGRWYRGLFLGAAGGVVAVNLLTAGSLYAAELIVGGQSWQIHGHVERMYKDCDAERTPALFVRQHLGENERLLMVGEARAYYMPANVDYCVVFSRNPFAEAVAAADRDEDIIRWLNDRGYTHVLVHWREMERLRRTYGFWDELNPSLFSRLEMTGLAVVKHFRDGQLRRYATLFEVRRLGAS